MSREGASCSLGCLQHLYRYIVHQNTYMERRRNQCITFKHVGGKRSLLHINHIQFMVSYCHISSQKNILFESRRERRKRRRTSADRLAVGYGPPNAVVGKKTPLLVQTLHACTVGQVHNNIMYAAKSTNMQWRIQGGSMGSAEPPFLSFCAHVSPALWTCTVKNVGQPLFKILDLLLC